MVQIKASHFTNGELFLENCESISERTIVKAKLLTQSKAKHFFQQHCERSSKLMEHHKNTKKKETQETLRKLDQTIT